jgi:uncharacterized protein (UPF0276 family)
VTGLLPTNKSVAARVPSLGISYRAPIHNWTIANLDLFDVIELTLDHCFWASPLGLARIRQLADSVPFIGHGIGLSLGTEGDLDMAYLDRIARLIEEFRLPAYSEHLAFTRAGGIETANLLQVPRTRAVAERLSEKIRRIQSVIPVPVQLENIAYYFEWPEDELTEVEFLSLIQRETGIELLLDVENVRVNAANHGFDARGYIDQLPLDSVAAIHVAGGCTLEGVHVDTHDHPVKEETLELVGYVLDRACPATIVLERDHNLEELDELRDDILSLRATIADRVPAIQGAT